MLKYHAHFAAHIINVFEVGGERNAVHQNVSLLMFFKPIDAAD